MNAYGKQKKPFFFLVNFLGSEGVVIPLSEINKSPFQYDFSNQKPKTKNSEFNFKTFPNSFKSYQKSFKTVHQHIRKGNSYLTNLTCKTPIKTNLTLAQIFELSNSKYKVLFQGKLVCFSPETFVKINNNQIFSYPMKGTIDADLPNAESILLNNKKETAEHYTIVDLIRNDLSIIATNVTVKKFRYIDKIESQQGNLLQMSSEIKGDLPNHWNRKLGSLLFKLLPAGSISGAPKQKTIEIIQESETQNRGFYTGVFGVFDGENLDSAVAIRFIEKEGEQLYYRSGGGITHLSNVEEEYKEMLNKIYVPIY